MVLAAGMALAIGWWTWHDPFDGEVWRGEADNWNGRNARGDMAGALRERIAPGTPREALHILLGAPDTAGARRDVYTLGRSRWGVELETLVITYDGQDRMLALTIQRT